MIKTRFAPSPTGLMHLGNVRTALFNALYAYHCQGTFLLRIEDTDQARSQTLFTQQLMADLRWLGLVWQEGPEVTDEETYYQSARSAVYAHYYAQLEQQQLAYPCFCSPQELALSRKLQRVAGQAPRYAGTCAHLSATDVAAKRAQGIEPTLRFRVTRGQKIEFVDLVRGQQQFLSDEIGDFIIRRADGTPAFFFCNAIDDALMKVTHVLRGEDHLTNTPRQQLILDALALPLPQYGHISLILGDEGTPLSKRNGSQSIQVLREQGWLAAGMLNYLARLGHTYSEEGYLTLPDLAAQFSIERLGKAPARFDEQQLRHWQQVAINHAEDTTLWDWMGKAVHALVPEAKQTAFIAAIRANVVYPEEALYWARTLFTDDMTPVTETDTIIASAGQTFFEHALSALEVAQGEYKALIQELKRTTGKQGKHLFMPLRVALTGKSHGPEMANLLPLMGIERARLRLQVFS